MKNNLYPHQREALSKMKDGCILNGGVGSGKTRTALSFYLEKHSSESLYIITTARKRDDKDWADEANELGIKNIIVDSWNNITKYINISQSFFIFDEQRIVGNGTWVKTFLQISKKNKWILLSATPGDVWFDYLPVFIANGFYKNKTEFINKHVIYKPFTLFPQVDRYINVSELYKHKNTITVPMLFERRVSYIEKNIFCGYDKILYNTTKETKWNYIKDEPFGSITEEIYSLRRIVNSSPERVQSVIDLYYKHDRIIVFYNFTYELELLRTGLTENNIYFQEWNGQKHEPTPSNKRWVYLVQYTAGAEGWNCITTNTIIFYSLNHSYKIVKQAKGRVDRLNTPYKDLYYYTLLSRSNIDHCINKCLATKTLFNERKYSSTFSQRV